MIDPRDLNTGRAWRSLVLIGCLHDYWAPSAAFTIQNTLLYNDTDIYPQEVLISPRDVPGVEGTLKPHDDVHNLNHRQTGPGPQS